MPDDIVARLREEGFITHMARLPRESKILHAAADEIERLRAIVQGWEHSARNAERDIAQLREQRDGARAEVCLLRTGPSAITDTVTQSMADYAESRGWNDLFRDEA